MSLIPTFQSPSLSINTTPNFGFNQADPVAQQARQLAGYNQLKLQALVSRELDRLWNQPTVGPKELEDLSKAMEIRFDRLA